MFFYNSIGSNWDMSLSNVQLRGIFKPMRSAVIVTIKKKQKCYKMFKYKKNLKSFMKSRSNSSNKAEKQISEAKIVIEIKLYFAGNGLWPVFIETDLQIDRKINKKVTKLKNPIMFLKTNICKSHKRFRISTNNDRLNCNTSGSHLGRLIVRLSHDPTKWQ